MPSGAVTLLDIAKTTSDDFMRDVIGTYASSYQPMAVLPMMPASGGRWAWDVEYQLPYTSGGARNFNATFTATKGAISSFSEYTRIYGGTIQIDPAMVRINPNKVGMERVSQIKAKAREFVVDMFEGAGGTYLRGIKDWLDNETTFASQTVNVGTASAGGVLITDHLDRILAEMLVIPGQTFMYTSKNIALRSRKLQRGNQVSGDVNYNIQYSSGEWGAASSQYNGVPIIPLVDGKGNDLISTTQGDGSSSTIYVVTYGAQLFTGFQQGDPYNRNVQDTTYDYFTMEHLVGTAPQAIKCIGRLQYINNAQ